MCSLDSPPPFSPGGRWKKRKGLFVSAIIISFLCALIVLVFELESKLPNIDRLNLFSFIARINSKIDKRGCCRSIETDVNVGGADKQ